MAGFLGVVVMVNPTGDVIRLAPLLPSGLRLQPRFETFSPDVWAPPIQPLASCSIRRYAGFVRLTVHGAGWHIAPEHRGLGAFLIAGFFVTSAHWLLIKAYQIAEASLVAPLRYVAIVYAVIIGFLVFDEQPGIAQFLGASIVIFAGVYIVRPERKHIG